METQNILVTGGAGFIGTNLVNELQSRGHNVLAVDLYNTRRNDYIRADVRNYRQLENVFENNNFDYVYHLAAEYGRWNGEDYYENLWQTNMIGTKNILRLQEKLDFRMIFYSSAEVYGDYNGKMSEDVMTNNPIKDTYQMNDYAITKWAGELMCMNSAKMFGTETVRVRPVNCYGPHEHYTPYRGFIPKFIYHALFNKPYTVYKGHKRIIDFVEDSCNTWANIVDNFIPGEAYNVAGRPEWEKDIKTYSDIILDAVGIDDSIVNYEEAEQFTTKVKTIDCSKAIRDLNHDPKVSPEEGIKKTVEWMKDYYRLE
ncbi:dTDP-glucose 4,6-dehydratase [Methanohalophilus euhalobius]|uniref:dTDP-glucose 4,6-dehydratase n=1 Tax=Methanohalophilus euhalobius TaxID=51203 RepID=A0A285GE66_9EURY|nr:MULTISPECIES: NAD(P)-dependent oxidoreductase [Methanohalophilus]ODV48840.1 MAG: dTDP-glucose 4,6-dehydratase [Methanohalophilus sp. 2-GBenrich]TCL11589.1 dTDP-glucose 4,6-dehydratase [Methanohalophilus euhalobius]SNY20681.1 dTDP-glucose 4,6-dehydratase [Methanohalophilus euhalobius]